MKKDQVVLNNSITNPSIYVDKDEVDDTITTLTYSYAVPTAGWWKVTSIMNVSPSEGSGLLTTVKADGLTTKMFETTYSTIDKSIVQIIDVVNVGIGDIVLVEYTSTGTIDSIGQVLTIWEKVTI